MRDVGNQIRELMAAIKRNSSNNCEDVIEKYVNFLITNNEIPEIKESFGRIFFLKKGEILSRKAELILNIEHEAKKYVGVGCELFKLLDELKKELEIFGE